MMTRHPSPLKSAAAPRLQPMPWAALVALGVMSISCGGLLNAPAVERPLTASEHALRNAAYRQAGTVVLPPVAPEERVEALLSMNRQEQPRDLVWLTLWDDCAEDGDIVSILTDEFSISVPLTRQPMRLAVPRPTHNLLSVHGVFDGGGGITVALATAYGPVPLPVMAPGQTVDVPVR
ncbi:hypothetical protein LNAOJCKE_4842 [Methylorubrum aminovorans]|jgi:hypothetical protein|uniref:Uncharacterized protein n=2 Tax=Methylorubrum TaxID=2282523 RepID=A0AA40VEF7_9HYPH|nr:MULTISPECIES: hypothetical protein [Methylorubrum]MBA8916065.1 hypothetical protein [Methylorubrum thiocyanatum]GJE67610.1 hypothetical protein LNAOJCKE_4842 [Methylorubrum aminovorans]GJE82223.1 hypothetical protein CJNNKLLH_3586 [Methylorubrum thiocyanatum]GMA80059.1 hypothetical protein GCM10025880_64760 [Methylorubrum aminovorans]GMA80122.1 hypothetical protein GCM10025880_65390 [Methylorubrum aminovorans]